MSMKPALSTEHHLNTQQLSDDMRLNMSSLVRLGKGPEKTMQFNKITALKVFPYFNMLYFFQNKKFHSSWRATK